MQVLLAFNSLIFSYTLVQATLLVSIHRFANSWMQDAWHKQRKKRGRRRQRRRQEIYFFFKPRILLSISLLWLSCVFVFSLKFRWLQRLLQNETMDVSSWNVGHVLKTAWKWSSWSLIWEQDSTNVSFISHIHVRFLSWLVWLVYSLS